MTATAPPVDPTAVPRHSGGFGGLTPGGAVGESSETIVSCLGVEHHQEGAAVAILILTASPGLVEWNPTEGLAVSDDAGGAYGVTPLSVISGLGQVEATVWITPAVPPEARALHLDVDGVLRVNPARGERGVARELSEGPWSIDVDLRPPRTLSDAPERPAVGRDPDDPQAVPARARALFDGVLPVGQARLVEGSAFCLTAVERYADRWIANVVALGPEDAATATPAVGRAHITAWDDVGTTYRLTALNGAADASWSQCSYEAVPALNPDASVLAVEMTHIPRGRDSGSRRLEIDGPIVFSSVIPA